MSLDVLNSTSESTSSVESLETDSLHSELQSIQDIVSTLKNFKPEKVNTPVKRKRGRPAKSPLQTVSSAGSNST